MSAHNSKTIINFYHQTLQEYPRGIKSYRWFYKKEQEVRFKELLKVAGSSRNLLRKSILDVGCGRGDLYKYLANQRIQMRYTGIDLITEFVSKAKELYPKAKFVEKDFLQWQTNNRYDYIIASGLLSVKLSDDNERRLQMAVKKMLKLARRGVAFNFLTMFRQKKFRWWHYYDPGEILNLCASLKTVRRLTLSMGYDPFDQFGDATISLFKKS